MLKQYPQILLTPDSNEGTLLSQTAPENDPFSQAATEIEDPCYPVLKPDRIIDMECKTVKIEKVKGTELDLLVIQIKTIKEEPTTDGRMQPAGLVGTLRVGITPHTGYSNADGKDIKPHTVEEIKAEMALLIRGFFGVSATHAPRTIFNNPNMIVGQVAKVKIGYKKAEGTFPEGNTFKIMSVKKA